MQFVNGKTSVSKVVDICLRYEKRNNIKNIALSILTGIIAGISAAWSYSSFDRLIRTRSINVQFFDTFKRLSITDQMKSVLFVFSALSVIAVIISSIYYTFKSTTKDIVLDRHYRSEIAEAKKDERQKDIDIQNKERIQKENRDKKIEDRKRTDAICQKCWPQMPGRSKFLELIHQHGFVLRSNITEQNFEENYKRSVSEFNTHYDEIISQQPHSLVSLNDQMKLHMLFDFESDSQQLMYVTRFTNQQHNNMMLNMIRLYSKKERVLLHLMDYLLNGEQCVPVDKLIDVSYVRQYLKS